MRRFLIISLSVAFVAVLAIAAAPALKRHSEFVRCGNQIHAVLFVAALEWPTEHGGCLPTNFVSMSNELSAPVLLVCPADHSRHPATNWASLTSDNCSYELVTPGLHKGDSNGVFLRCKIHGYIGYADDRLLDACGRLVKPNRLW
jgi:hypothetical protein